MTREEYEAIDAVNWSTLKHLGKSGEHYLHALKAGGGGDTDARQRGRVTHLAVFEPERFSKDVVVFSDTRRGPKWTAFEKQHEGKEIVTPRMFEHAKSIADRARNHPMAARYLAGGKSEHTVTWLYQSPRIESLPYWEIECKGRLDFIADVGAIVDLKSTRDGSPTGFGREAARYEYHAQLAFYRDGYEAMTGVRLPVIIVAVEAAAPFVVQVYRLEEELLDLGRERYELLLAQLRICRDANKWPGYAEAEMQLELPRWARPLDDDEELDGDLVFAE